MMLDHLSIQCPDVAASAAFYDTVRAPLGVLREVRADPDGNNVEAVCHIPE